MKIEACYRRAGFAGSSGAGRDDSGYHCAFVNLSVKANSGKKGPQAYFMTAVLLINWGIEMRCSTGALGLAVWEISCSKRSEKQRGEL